MSRFVCNMAVLAIAMLLADAQPTLDPAPAPVPQHEGPSSEQVASMQLSQSLRQAAAALQEGRDALKELSDWVTGVNITRKVHEAERQALHSDDPDLKEREALEDEISRNLEALSASVKAEVDGLASDEAKSAAEKLQNKAAKAAEKAKKAAAKSEALQTKAKELAEKEANAAAKAKTNFQEAVKYSADEVSNILRQEAEAQQRAAEKLAQKRTEQEAREKALAAEAAADAKKIAEAAAATAAEEAAARKQADELEARASASHVPTMLLEEVPDPTSAPRAPAPARAEDDATSEVDRVERKAQEKAVSSAPKRLVKSIRRAASKLKRLQDEHREAVERALFDEHKKHLADIEAKVGQAKEAAARAKDFARTASEARTALGQPAPTGEPSEEGQIFWEADGLKEDKIFKQAKELEDQIFREARHELKKAVEKDIAEDKEEARAWTSAAEKMLREHKRAEHEDRSADFAAVPSASSPLSLLAVSLGVAGFMLAGRSINRRSIRQQPPLLG